MKHQYKLGLLLILTFLAISILFFLPPIPQSPAYHNFADKRSFRGIPNFANVISNLPFVFIGIIGLYLLYRTKIPGTIFSIYLILFLGILLTGLGSAYYHVHPDNNTLVWDRIPMTLVFMALLSATIVELVNQRLGSRLLIPLVLIGIASVWWWHYTELQGKGDLRFYGFVQFYPVIFIPFLLGLFYDPVQKRALLTLGWVVIWYLVAKIGETYDRPIYSVIGVSGHTLKHLAAAASTWYLVILFQQKYRKQE